MAEMVADVKVNMVTNMEADMVTDMEVDTILTKFTISSKSHNFDQICWSIGPKHFRPEAYPACASIKQLETKL